MKTIAALICIYYQKRNSQMDGARPKKESQDIFTLIELKFAH